MRYFKKIIEWFINLNTFIKLMFYRQDKVLLLLSPQYVNYGDHAIAYSSLQRLKEIYPDKHVFEITFSFYEYWSHFLKLHVSNQDILIISGGGFLGDIWPVFQKYTEEIISSYPDNHIVIFPQTIYFKEMVNANASREVFLSHQKLHICLREHNSYKFVTESWLPEKKDSTLLVPDMVLGLSIPKPNKQNTDVLLCLRTDKEKIISTSAVNTINNYLINNNLTVSKTSMAKEHVEFPTFMRHLFLFKKFKEYSNAKVVITDRLHGMIFAIVTSTPCLAFDNVSHKVSGVYNWLEGVDYVEFADDERLESQLNYLLHHTDSNYDLSYFSKHSTSLRNLLESLAERSS